MVRTRVIDTHAHWYPDEFLALLEKDGPRHGASVTRAAGSITILAGSIRQVFPPIMIGLDERLQSMDRTGIDVHALSLTTPMVYWAAEGFALALSQAFNDAASRAHQKHPDRFVGMAMLPMHAPKLALRELERAAKLPGMRGIYVATNVIGTELDDKAFWPIYATCQDLGWPVFLHPVEKTLGADRTTRFHLRNLLGNPYDTGMAAAHLIFGGVLDEFPRLEVLLPHAGGTLPGLIGRLDHGTKVRSELRHMKQLPSAYLRRFTYDTIGHNDQIMMNLVRLVGADRIMLGSDYCLDMGVEQPVGVVDRMTALSSEERNLILGGTAARMLKIAV